MHMHLPHSGSPGGRHNHRDYEWGHTVAWIAHGGVDRTRSGVDRSWPSGPHGVTLTASDAWTRMRMA